MNTTSLPITIILILVVIEFCHSETISKVMIKEVANLTGSHYCSCFVIISHLFGTEDLSSSDMFSAFTVSVCLPTSVCERCPQSKEATERTGKPFVSHL